MPVSDKRLLIAALVAPMTAAALREGGVVMAGGRIVAIGGAAALRRDHPDAAVEDLGNALLLPGLVNSHAHLELSWATPGERPASFVDWIIRLLDHPAHRDPSAAPRAIKAGVAQCLRFGTTTIGDITANPAVTRAVLHSLPIRDVSYGEIRAMGQRRPLLNERIAAAGSMADGPQMRIGISPHAPYSVEPAGYAAALKWARQRSLPITTHLAETPDEADFLEHHHGPLRQLWRHLDAWDQSVPRFDGGPIRLARSVGLLDHPTLLAHVNYCDDDELDLLASGRASVVYCPRTHAYFGHPPHRWRDMLARGVNVAIGTDSCASSPDLNLLDDLRLIHRLAPEIPVADLWKLVTIHGARALEMSDVVGSLEPGKAADLVAFDMTTADPLAQILETGAVPRRVWIAGQPVGPG